MTVIHFSSVGALASCMMSSVSRNRRDARGNPPLLTPFGWGMMSFSIATGQTVVTPLVA